VLIKPLIEGKAEVCTGRDSSPRNSTSVILLGIRAVTGCSDDIEHVYQLNRRDMETGFKVFRRDVSIDQATSKNASAFGT